MDQKQGECRRQRGSSGGPGYFVISLDFELFWGMFDKHSLSEYGENVRGELTAVPRLLTAFEEGGIHATWATVGMLMTRSKAELIGLIPPPELRPVYEDMDVSSYRYIETKKIGENEIEDPYHFGTSLVRKILATPHQEIANHTFSHFYCVDGHTNSPEIFAADLEAHHKIAKTYGVTPTSIVFPRNQSTRAALLVCAQHGITAFRGNEDHFLYRPRKDSEQSYFIRGLRLLDHYLNITGYHTYPVPSKESGVPIDIPSSRFLRPWSITLSTFEFLRLRRIKRSMTHAAKNGEVFHLWWHPHNFGVNQEENFKNLEEILSHFMLLKKQYGFTSVSMKELADIALRD